MNWPRLLVASLVSLLVIPAISIPAGIFWGVSYGEIYSGLVFVYIPIAFVIAVAFGTPMFLLFRVLHIERLFAYLLGGVTIGVLTTLIINGLFSSSSVELSHFAFWLTGCVLTSVTFWLFVLPARFRGELPVSTQGEV